MHHNSGANDIRLSGIVRLGYVRMAKKLFRHGEVLCRLPIAVSLSWLIIITCCIKQGYVVYDP